MESVRSDITDLAQLFSSYTTGVSIDNIDRYLVQFDNQHIATAMKMLQKVDYYDGPRIIELAKCLTGKIRERNRGTFGGVRLCPMTTKSGDSAEWMQRLLRNIDKSDPEERRAMNQSMKSIYELEGLADDTNPKLIVLLDHFIGTGDSIITKWGHMRQWQNNNHKYVVVVLVAYEDAVEKIRNETDLVLDIISGVVLPAKARAFHRDNHDFSDIEKSTLKKYCKIVECEQMHQYGHNNSQSLVIFYDRSPNNALPVLHKKKLGVWVPLFPRYF